MKKLKKLIAAFYGKENAGMLNPSSNKQVDFILTLDTLNIGTLSYADNDWKFSYSEEFKKQKDILPLVPFPIVNEVYSSSVLWPFFVSRIPSVTQLHALDEGGKEDIISLLKNYGRKTIANPYLLIPV